MTETPLIFPALGALYTALGPWAEALLRFAVGAAMVPHGLRMCLGCFKGTGGPIDNVAAVAALYDRKGYRPGWLWATVLRPLNESLAIDSLPSFTIAVKSGVSLSYLR